MSNPSTLQWNHTLNWILNYHIVTPEDTCTVHIVSRNQQEPSLVSIDDLQDSVAHGGPEDSSSSWEPAGVGWSSGGYGSHNSLDLEERGYDFPQFPIGIGIVDLATGYKG